MPYGDVFMEIDEPFRRRGFGAYFVQELKRQVYRRRQHSRRALQSRQSRVAQDAPESRVRSLRAHLERVDPGMSTRNTARPRVVSEGMRVPALFLAIALGALTAIAGAAAQPAAAPQPVVAELAALDQFTVIGVKGGVCGRRGFLKFMSDAEAGVKEADMFAGRGPIAILVIVFLGGLALNLTPCVLPMIPINLAVIGAGTQAGSRRRGFLLGGAYGAGMALAYGVLGVIVTLTASTFGMINSSPWFNAASRCCSCSWRWPCSTSSTSTSRASGTGSRRASRRAAPS